MYQVIENDVPCEYPYHKVHSSWNKSTYDTFLGARNYARKWLGVYAPINKGLKLNEPYVYNGYDAVTIIRID